jgi:predicted peptidase
VTFGGGNILFMLSDINAGSSADADSPYVAFGLVDNVRVETLTTVAPEPAQITGIKLEGGNVKITFTAQNAQPADFTVEGAGTVPGTFSAETGATILAVGAGQFEATLPAGAGQRFFRIRR